MYILLYSSKTFHFSSFFLRIPGVLGSLLYHLSRDTKENWSTSDLNLTSLFFKSLWMSVSFFSGVFHTDFPSWIVSVFRTSVVSELRSVYGVLF